MTTTVLGCGLLVALGLVGVVVPVLPGTALVALGIGIWAGVKDTTAGWLVFAVAAAILVAGAVVKYVVPGRRLKASVPTRTLMVGALGGVVGFFVIPVVGALAGFPIGVYLAERVRVGSDAARASTVAALRAVGASILIELTAALAAAVTWVAGIAAT